MGLLGIGLLPLATVALVPKSLWFPFGLGEFLPPHSLGTLEGEVLELLLKSSPAATPPPAAKGQNPRRPGPPGLSSCPLDSLAVEGIKEESSAILLLP